MTLLKDILNKVSLLSTSGNPETEVSAIAFDSRKVTKGSLFVATSGTVVDGHDYINKAIENGAIAIVCEKLPLNTPDNVAFVQVKNSAVALGHLAANFYNNPSEKLKIVAVTGTNGKTTTATLLFKLFRALGYNVGLLSTVQNQINEEIIPSTHTTPDALAINQLLRLMIDKGCTHCFMEASSHAIHQERMAGIQITGAMFSNITHDHLDYHGTFDNYIAAKKKLFDDLPASAFALVNVDDKRGKIMLQNSKASKYTFALKTPADYKGKIVSNTLEGLELDINGQQAWFRLIGEFNAYNLVGIYGAACLLGEDPMEVLTQLSAIETAKGRFEQIIGNDGITAIVDYAHTPDALKNVLETISTFKETGVRKVITVVGCGGDRDKTKRPIMAEIACKLSDKVIITSDNPRSEEPEAIIEEMMKGVSAVNYKKVLKIIDRREAIKTACMLASKDDIILVAGKGHENYQEIKGVKHPFDDKEELIKVINDLK